MELIKTENYTIGNDWEGYLNGEISTRTLKTYYAAPGVTKEQISALISDADAVTSSTAENGGRYITTTTNEATALQSGEIGNSARIGDKWTNNLCKKYISKDWKKSEEFNEEKWIANFERTLINDLINSIGSDGFAEKLEQLKGKQDWQTINRVFINRGHIPKKLIKKKPPELDYETLSLLQFAYPDMNNVLIYTYYNELLKKLNNKFTEQELALLIKLNPNLNMSRDECITFFNSSYYFFKLQILRDYVTKNANTLREILKTNVYSYFNTINRQIIDKNLDIFRAMMILKTPEQIVFGVLNYLQK